MTVHVMNAATLAPTEYSLSGVLAVVEHTGETYFVTATGLSKLGAGSVPNVTSRIQTGKIRPETLNGASFSVPQVQMLAAGQDVVLELTAEQYGEPVTERYPLELVKADVPRGHLELTDAGIEGTSWTVAVEATGPFYLRALGLLVNAIQTWRR